MSTEKEKKFYWNEDTLNHFKLNSNYQNKQEVINEITSFVENNCSLENNETEEDLIKDLTKQVYNK
jgi:mannitol/fructose-specific phosphotransferase system IIA component (Ntr-type)